MTNTAKLGSIHYLRTSASDGVRGKPGRGLEADDRDSSPSMRVGGDRPGGGCADTKWDPDAGPSLRTRVGHDSQEPRGKPLAERAARAWTPTLG